MRFAVTLVLTLAGALNAAEPVYKPKINIEGIKVGTFLQEMTTVFTKNAGLPDAAAQGVVITEAGVVFAGTQAGLARFEAGKWLPVQGLPTGPARPIACVGKTVHVVVGAELYRLNNDAWEKTCGAVPTAATCLAVGGDVAWIGTAHGLYSVKSGELALETALQSLLTDGPQIRQVATGPKGEVAVAASGGLFLMRDGRWTRLFPKAKHYSWAVHDARGVAFDRNGRLWFCSPQGAGCLDGAAWKLYTGLEGLPYNDFTTAAAGEKGVVWFGTTIGAIRFDGSTWGYRQGRRWLPDDTVNAIAVDEKGNAWFATSQGVGLIERRPMTLPEKAKAFEERIDKRHRRTPYGYVNECGLKAPGDLSVGLPMDSDNEGLWTGMYGAGECFAYAATKDPEARKRAKAAFEALKFLCDVTQGGEKTVQKGFPARSIISTAERNPNEGHNWQSDLEGRKGDSLWKVMHPRWPKSADGKWYWKCDTSSDETDGHYFLNLLYYDLVADTDDEKARVRQVICDTTDHLMNNGYALVDWDGKQTRWAYFGPQDLNDNPERCEERGMNSLGILAYLTTAHHVSGDAKYIRAKEELVRKHKYAMNAMVCTKVHDGAGTGNQSDDEMTIMRYFALLRYETDPQVRAMIEWSFWRYWIHVRRSRNPFFNFLYAATYDPKSRPFWNGNYEPTGNWLQDSVDELTGQSMDLVNWSLRNSHRLDVLVHHEWPRYADGRPTKGYMRDGGVLPIENRYIQHWSEDHWRLDQGGDGRTESDGAYWLMAYYAGKYFGFIKD